ncbi:vitrin [Lingula anatina]|uniref:Vitrin n=1 Tax=Lingula anatina TaxID=7574 RepID=A0A1S3JI00_LINAN|nr:vitrin [Lingula anatina]|eukprot:XP_013410017.1 vitrin [Lingula anatina]
MQLVKVLVFCLALVSIDKGSQAVNVDYQASLINNKLSSLMAPKLVCSGYLWFRSCVKVPPKLDTLLVLDSSGSITSYQFGKEKDAAKVIVDYIHNKAPIGYYKSRVGLIEYSVYAHFEFKFNEYNTPAAIKNRIQLVTYDNGWRTATAIALGKAKTEMQANSRPGNVKVVWVFTDGRSNYGGNPKIPADQLRAIGTTVCIMVIGPSINWAEIHDIGNKDCIFQATSFYQALQILSRAYSLSKSSPTLSDNFFSGLKL